MRVVFVNRFFHPDLSATSQLLSDLAFELSAQGVAVQIVASRLKYDDGDAWLPAFELVKGVQVHRVRTSRFGRRRLLGRAVDYLTFYTSASWWLLARLQRHDVLVVKTDPPLMGLFATPLAKWRGARVVNWVQDLFPEVARELGVGLARGRIGRLLERARDLALRHADANVALGDRMAAYLGARGVPGNRIAVIHNWANGEAIVPLAREDNPLRAEWGLGDAFVVGYSGNLGRAHDFEAILEAAQALSSCEDIVFLIIGEGQAKASLEQAARSLGLRRMCFMPYQPRERLPWSLTLFDVHLVSLRPELEGLIVPSKLYGALAAGRPVLFLGESDGEAAMVLRQHECGYTVDAKQGQALARAIVALYEKRDMAERMGANARQAFETRFTRDVALRRWEALLRRCAQGRSA